jgi:hypothetical protein
MSVADELRAHAPGAGAVRVRIYDPPVRGYPARFYPETGEPGAHVTTAAARAARPLFLGSAARADHRIAGRPSHGRYCTHASG